MFVWSCLKYPVLNVNKNLKFSFSDAGLVFTPTMHSDIPFYFILDFMLIVQDPYMAAVVDERFASTNRLKVNYIIFLF